MADMFFLGSPQRNSHARRRGTIKGRVAMIVSIAILTVAGEWIGDALAQEPAAKHPIPSKAVQDRIVEKLGEIFDFAAAKKPEQQVNLAKELFKLSEETKKNPDEQFVLLRRTMELACEGGDAALMIQAIDVIGSAFNINPMDVKVKMLQKFAKEAKTQEKIDSLMVGSRPVLNRAMKEHNYDAALNLVEAIYAAAQRPGGSKYRKRLLKQRTELRELYKQYDEYQKALTAIEANPADKAASLVLGRWRCFVENDWEQGLFYLVESDDAELKAAAQSELDASSGTGAESAKVGNTWWDLAEKKEGEEKLTLMRHAAEWYEKAQGQEIKGLAKLKIEKRLKELEEALAAVTATGEDEPEETPTRRPSKRKRSIVFRADKSMKPYPPGTKLGEAFPRQQVVDPRGPFEGQPVYFQQNGKKDKAIYYEIEWNPPVREIQFRGAAMFNMTMEVLDAKGQVVARSGPHGGGNHWGQFGITVPPKVGSRFVLHFHNEASTWFFIGSLQMR